MRVLKVLLITILLVALTLSVVSASNNLIDIDIGSKYTSQQLYEIALSLQNTYPEIIRVEILGYSFDNRPIYSVVMTADINQHDVDSLYTERMHFFYEAGNHAREDVNPIILLAAIEEYAKAYRNSGLVGNSNMVTVLNRSVLHFIPMANPDGFDLVRQGLSAAQTDKAKQSLANISDKNYGNFKAGMSGVDHNRNYPTDYYDFNNQQWVSIWGKYVPSLISYQPSAEFYGGPYPGSEPEVKIIMDYVSKYDFRNHLSFHSRGKIIYYDRVMFGNDFNARSRTLVQAISNVTGYRIIPPRSEVQGTGYFSDFVAAETHKPIMTIETLTAGVKLPTSQNLYREAYRENRLAPLAAEIIGHQEGYFKYRLYVDGVYKRDFNDYDYALAHAKKHGGIIVEGGGVPELTLDNLMTREEFITRLLELYVEFIEQPQSLVEEQIEDSEGSEEIEGDTEEQEEIDRIQVVGITGMGFEDFDTFVGNYIKLTGIVNGFDNNKFRPGHFITAPEAAVMIHKTQIFFNRQDMEVDVAEYPQLTFPIWAKDQSEYVLSKGYIKPEGFQERYLSRENLRLFEDSENNFNIEKE